MLHRAVSALQGTAGRGRPVFHHVQRFGNATLAFREDERSVRATDPWLTDTCYFGSWGLDRPLAPDELALVQAAE